jgi:hypothetical protein
MQTFIITAVAGLALLAGTLSASAGVELDKALGAGSFMNPTGPAHGVWNEDARPGK